MALCLEHCLPKPVSYVVNLVIPTTSQSKSGLIRYVGVIWTFISLSHRVQRPFSFQDISVINLTDGLLNLGMVTMLDYS